VRIKKNSIVQDFNGNTYLFRCYSLVIGYCVVTNTKEEWTQIPESNLKVIIGP
jgi:hypothetical protein